MSQQVSEIYRKPYIKFIAQNNKRMTFNLSLKTFKAKLLTALITLVVCALLVIGAVWYLVISTLSDDRIPIPHNVLVAAVQYFPNSPRLQARLAATEFTSPERDLDKAEAHAREAVRLLPNEYSYRLMLASILEAKGDRDAAEQSYRDALRLAPNFAEVHWRLANVLVRQGKAKESLDHFRVAAASNTTLLPGIYDLIWNLSNGSIEDITYVTGKTPKAQIALAQFLLSKNKVSEAANVYSSVDRTARREDPDSAGFLTQLAAIDHLEVARDLWLKVVTDKPENAPNIWNGSFEVDILPRLTQFDWQLSGNDFARVAIDPSVGRSGSRSLRVMFSGRDTTRLYDQIKQLVLVKPGVKYRLECYYKTRELRTPEGPTLAVMDRNFQTQIAASTSVPEGTNDWQQLSLEFTAPANAKAVQVSFQRIPKYAFDNPTQGIVWLDDFSLKEQ
ncbi:MAG TPA: tetratricopeptide repeat protein [Blastocatellia bacterium]|nr:tetratricopeptide repeat protein [Blastocatellia bacterium]